MYLEHFGFRQQPFGTAPDPGFLYFSPQHAEALATLHYGLLERRGLLALIAPPGMGKTTLLYHVLNLWKSRADTAFIFHPPETREEMLTAVLEDLGLVWPGCYREGCRLLHAHAVETWRRGRRLVLVLDEAQHLSTDVLEQIRLLSNFERPSEKLVEIILAGQPALEQRLATPQCEQFRQRLAITGRIEKLEPAEVRRYVEHRLRVAGRSKNKLFTRSALSLLAEASGGAPRNINAICFEALSAACSQGKKRVDEEEIRRAALFLCAQDAPFAVTHRKPKGRRVLRWAAGAAGILLTAMLPSTYFYKRHSHPATTEAAAPQVSSVSHFETENRLPPQALPEPGSEEDDAEPPEAAASPERPPPYEIRVQRFDTLRQIALRHYGQWNQHVWGHIQKHNEWLRHPDRLEAGRVLVLPPWESRAAAGKDPP